MFLIEFGAPSKIQHYITMDKAHGLTIEIDQDECPESPREWDNVGTMVHWHRRYDLGDRRVSDARSFLLELMQDREWREQQKEVPDEIPDEHISSYIDKHFWILPLFLYDHSGLSMRIRNFDCSWDSGQVGFIYTEKCDEPDEETARQTMKSEVKTYDQYLTGDVYYFIIKDDNGNILDSCSGLFGYEYAKEAALEAAQGLAETLATSYSI